MRMAPGRGRGHLCWWPLIYNVSEFLQPDENIEVFGDSEFGPEWNNGTLDIGFQKDNSHFNVIVNPPGGGNINPTLHYPLRATGQNPLFHYSIVPSFQSHDLVVRL